MAQTVNRGLLTIDYRSMTKAAVLDSVLGVRPNTAIEHAVRGPRRSGMSSPPSTRPEGQKVLPEQILYHGVR